MGLCDVAVERDGWASEWSFSTPIEIRMEWQRFFSFVYQYSTLSHAVYSMVTRKNVEENDHFLIFMLSAIMDTK